MKTTVVSIRESPGVLRRFLLLEGKAKGKQANKWLKLLVHVDETENNSVNSFTFKGSPETHKRGSS